MTSLCTFAVFLFLLSIASVGLLLQHKDDILGGDPLDEDLSAHLPSLGMSSDNGKYPDKPVLQSSFSTDL
jgi:hypothetical protein